MIYDGNKMDWSGDKIIYDWRLDYHCRLEIEEDVLYDGNKMDW